jgi:hypothetical protein
MDFSGVSDEYLLQGSIDRITVLASERWKVLLNKCSRDSPAKPVFEREFIIEAIVDLALPVVVFT